MRDTAADISRARELLGYRSLVSIEEGIQAQALWQIEQIARSTGA